MNLEILLEDLLKKEGGYVNHPLDRGGATNYGVTLKTYRDLYGNDLDENDLKNMTVDIAKDIYKHEYYLDPKIDKLDNELQGIVFDMAVNHGPIKAVKILQSATNYFNTDQLKIDGHIGPKTIQMTTQTLLFYDKKFINKIVDNRVVFYKDIVDNDKTQKIFLNGWIQRADSFRVDIG